MTYEPNDKPTFYFIGVTTGQSSIMKLFPLWAKELGLQNVRIKGMDLPINAAPELYREAVSFIKNDPNSLGALVTTHKIDLFRAAKDLFDELDEYAELFEELSSISKADSRFIGRAKDPITSGLTLQAFVPDGFWARKGEALLMGAGGSTLAISAYLTQKSHGDNVPRRIIVSDISDARLASAKALLSKIDAATEFEFVLCKDTVDNDKALRQMPNHSLVVNATGLGKDRPGSPLTDEAVFPADSLVWELNYRGDLLFLRQANEQMLGRRLQVQDGWVYFLHGWTQVMNDVFHIEIDKQAFGRLEAIALEQQKQ